MTSVREKISFSYAEKSGAPAPVPVAPPGVSWVSSGFCDEAPQAGWLSKHRQILLTALEAGGPSSGGQPGGVVVRTSQVQMADAASCPRTEGGQ